MIFILLCACCNVAVGQESLVQQNPVRTSVHLPFRGIANGGSTCFIAAPLTFLLPLLTMAPRSFLYNWTCYHDDDDEEAPELTRKACRLFQTMLGIWVPYDGVVDGLVAIGKSRDASLAAVQFREVEAMLHVAFEDPSIKSEDAVTSSTASLAPGACAPRPYMNPRFHKYHAKFPMRYLSEANVWLLQQQDAPEILRLIMSLPVFDATQHDFQVLLLMLTGNSVHS
jgi:hypothetical protein